MIQKLLLSAGIIILIICSNFVTYSVTEYNNNTKRDRELIKADLGGYNNLLDFELKSKDQIGIEWYINKMRQQQEKESHEKQSAPNTGKLGGRMEV